MSLTNQLTAKRQEYNAKVSEINHFLTETGSQSWTAENQAKHDGMADELERLGKQIDAMKKAQERDIEENFKDIDDFKNDAPKAKDGFDIFLRKSPVKMSRDEALLIRNTMSTTTGSEGGYTVPNNISTQLIEKQKAYAFMRAEAGQLTTSDGQPLSYPTTDGTSEVGEWVAQNADADAEDISFGTVALNVHKAGSKIVAIPIELLQDSIIDVQALVINRLAQRIGRLANVGYTTGSGSGQPQGFVGVATVGKVGASGQTTTIIYDDLVDLIDSVDVAYQMNGTRQCFMGTQTMRKTLRKIKDSAGRPIWVPSYDAGYVQGFRDSILGYDYCLNNDMAVPAASAKSLAFGDFSKYIIRDCMDVTMFRFDDSRYMSKGQVGFLAWCRTGGNLIDTNSLRLYQHAAS